MSGADISAEVRPIAVIFCLMVELLFGGDIFRSLQMRGQESDRGSVFRPLKTIWPKISR